MAYILPFDISVVYASFAVKAITTFSSNSYRELKQNGQNWPFPDRSFNLTRWHFMTYDDIWWHLRVPGGVQHGKHFLNIFNPWIKYVKTKLNMSFIMTNHETTRSDSERYLVAQNLARGHSGKRFQLLYTLPLHMVLDSLQLQPAYNTLLASCPWGPVTANGVDILTEMYVIYMERNTTYLHTKTEAPRSNGLGTTGVH